MDDKRPKPADQPRDSILGIIGIRRSKEPTNIAEHEKEYLAEAIEPTR